MRRAALLGVAGILLAACTSSGATTEVLGEQITRSPQPVVTAEASPTAAPTADATATPTDEPATTPTATPSATDSPSAHTAAADDPSPVSEATSDPSPTAAPSPATETGEATRLQSVPPGDGYSYVTWTVGTTTDPDGTTHRTWTDASATPPMSADGDTGPVLRVTLDDANGSASTGDRTGVCTAWLQTDPNERAVVHGTVDASLVVDGDAVTTTSTVVDRELGPDDQVTVARTDPRRVAIDAVQQVTCQVTFRPA